MSPEPAGEIIELEPPLPGLARSVRIEFRSGDMGRLKRSAPAHRVDATHAVVTTVSATGKEVREDVEVQAVDQLMATVEEFRTKVSAKRADNVAKRADTEAQVVRRAEVAATFSSPCTRCGVDREHSQTQHVVTGSGDNTPTSTTTGWVSLPTLPYAEYICPICGSVEWFRLGYLDHPAG
jgi:uncharacterized protein YcbX